MTVPRAVVPAAEVDLLDRETFAALARYDVPPCVSFYLPTARAGAEVQQGPIRLRNLLRAAEAPVVRQFGSDARAVLEPVEGLLDDPWFWQYQSDGLAVFSAPGLWRTVRVPLAFDERAAAGQSFHLSPLLPLLSGDGQFFVLALSQKEIRLFEGSRLAIGQLDAPGVPAGLSDALGDIGEEQQLQVRSVTPTGRGERSAAFHGHAGGGEDKKEVLERYFRVVDRAVSARLAGERAPLILAAVSYYVPLYRRISNYPNVVEEAVVGNPDGLSAAELHARAWPSMERHFAAERQAALAAYAAGRGPGPVASVEEAVAAAVLGRVATLFVARGATIWGRVDLLTGAAEVHDEVLDGDVDLLDVAATRTFLTGGAVYVLDPPDIPEPDEPVAARLRY
ncbi:MAG: hypothetical protein ACRDYF_12025 [Acidimicrobiia bacterium]